MKELGGYLYMKDTGCFFWEAQLGYSNILGAAQ